MAVAAAIGAAALTLGPTLPAHAASDPSGDVQCVMVVGAPDASTNMAKTIVKACGAPGGAAPQVAAASSKRLLMTWYKGADYSGDSTKIYGYDGGCGNYGIEYVGDKWNDKIHSFRTFANCHYTRAFQNKKYGGWCYAYDGDAHWVGTGVTSFWLSDSYKRC